MGLSQLSGSLDQPLIPESNGNLVDVADPVPHNEEYLGQQVHVRDAFHNRTALNIDRDSSVINALKGFAEGSPILVTWFHNMESVANKKTTYSDLSFLSDTVNHGYHRINNFELRLQTPLEFSYDDAQNTSTITGNGLIFPGFIPKTGDLFIYEIEPGILGLFKVTGAPTRLSVRVKTSHVAPFIMVRVLNNTELVEILDRVREESWFNKQRFLNESTALLTNDDVEDLEYIKVKLRELIPFYIEKFYDQTTYKSFVRVDDVYDPYIVEFIKKTIDTYPYGIFVEQLICNPDNMRGSFWAKLLDPKARDWEAHVHDAYTLLYELPATASRVTSLINRPYIKLIQDTTDIVDPFLYVSDNIGGIDTSVFTPFDMLIAMYMEYQAIDIDILVQLIADIYTAEDTDQFYQIPVLVYMLNRLGNAIHTGEQIKLARPDQLPYQNIEFTQPDDRIELEILTILSPGSKVIGLLDDTDMPIYPEHLDVTYTSTGFTINLAPIKAEHGIVGDITGTWKVVISNTSLVLV